MKIIKSKDKEHFDNYMHSCLIWFFQKPKKTKPNNQITRTKDQITKTKNQNANYKTKSQNTKTRNQITKTKRPNYGNQKPKTKL